MKNIKFKQYTKQITATYSRQAAFDTMVETLKIVCFCCKISDLGLVWGKMYGEKVITDTKNETISSYDLIEKK